MQGRSQRARTCSFDSPLVLVSSRVNVQPEKFLPVRGALLECVKAKNFLVGVDATARPPPSLQGEQQGAGFAPCCSYLRCYPVGFRFGSLSFRNGHILGENMYDDMWTYAINNSGEAGEIVVYLVVIGIPMLMAILVCHDYLNW